MTAIDVAGVLSQLEAHRAQHEASSTATAFNLVTFVENDKTLSKLLSQRVSEIEARNPSRTIMLFGDGVETQVESEHVKLPVDALDATQLRSIVHDLLVPNVRTVLMWAGPHVDDPRFQQIGGLCDVIIIFSSASGKGIELLREVVRLRGTPFEAKLHDLAFLRLYPWQDTIAQFFDDDELAGLIPHISNVEVTSGTLPEAYYLIGWLASRLQWQPCGAYEFCNADGRSVAISMEQDGAPRRVYCVTLQCGNATLRACVHPDEDDLLCLSVKDGSKRPEECVPLHDVDMVSLIERAIFVPSSQQIYNETLDMVERLLQHQE